LDDPGAAVVSAGSNAGEAIGGASDYGVGPHDDQGGAPVPPTLGEEDPKQSVRRAEVWTRDRSPQHGQLLTEREIFQRDRAVPAADQSD
jgi:hypothetical protein